MLLKLWIFKLNPTVFLVSTWLSSSFRHCLQDKCSSLLPRLHIIYSNTCHHFFLRLLFSFLYVRPFSISSWFVSAWIVYIFCKELIMYLEREFILHAQMYIHTYIRMNTRVNERENNYLSPRPGWKAFHFFTD